MIIDEIKQLCSFKFPEEACGCVCNDKFFPLENKAENKADHLFVEYEQIEAIEQREGAKVTEVIHSHTNGQIYASEEDIRTQIALGIPFGIISVLYHTQEDKHTFSDIYYIGKTNPQLIGRPYIFGVNDCYTLVMDTLKLKYNIEIPNFARKWGWEETDNLFEKNFESAGFSEIPINDVEPGDCALMSFKGFRRNITHCAIYVGDDKILHHTCGKKPVDFSRTSKEELVQHWIPNVVKWVRYNA